MMLDYKPQAEDRVLAEEVPIADDQTHVLKHENSFAVFNPHGDIRPRSLQNHGLYRHGTRFLSLYVLSLDGTQPLLLNSRVKELNDFITVNMMNAAFETASGVVPSGSVYIHRLQFLWRGAFYEQLRMVNFSSAPVQFTFALHFEADFADIFEVRGFPRNRRGEKTAQRVDDTQILIEYWGLDETVRQSRVRFERPPETLTTSWARYTVSLDSHDEESFGFSVTCEAGGETVEVRQFDDAYTLWRNEHRGYFDDLSTIESSNESVNEWLGRSTADLFMMVTPTEYGLYPYAGIPWYSTIFGRDGIIAALHTLWLHPHISRGVLQYLAAHQATKVDPVSDAEPGKILHEQRSGEMAHLGEVPFANYYGTIDATPLFVVLAGKYYERTGDRRFMEKLWPNIEAALEWMNRYGDRDGDGFIEYQRHYDGGLVNQGWKDSHDSVFHDDGSDALGPIALCEVQGYAYEAKIWAGKIAAALDKPETAEILQREALLLRQRFAEAFWCESIGSYALALDGDKRPCCVRASNAGHCLLSGIAHSEHAARVATELLRDDFFSGWGIRTVAAGQPRYNPMSYHNGSVWPHDTAMVAAGLARYGYKKEVSRIFGALFDASRFVELHRLPELMCGFRKREGEGPTLYPVACEPQTWATTSVYFMVQASLGLSVRTEDRAVVLDRPVLPSFIDDLTIRQLQVGTGRVDFKLIRHKHNVGVQVLNKSDESLAVFVVN